MCRIWPPVVLGYKRNARNERMTSLEFPNDKRIITDAPRVIFRGTGTPKHVFPTYDVIPQLDCSRTFLSS